MVKPLESAKKVEVKTRSNLREWLQVHYGQKSGIWLVTYKKNHKYYLPYNDIVEECLCFGWVDSLAFWNGLKTPNVLKPEKNVFKKLYKRHLSTKKPIIRI